MPADAGAHHSNTFSGECRSERHQWLTNTLITGRNTYIDPLLIIESLNH